MKARLLPKTGCSSTYTSEAIDRAVYCPGCMRLHPGRMLALPCMLCAVCCWDCASAAAVGSHLSLVWLQPHQPPVAVLVGEEEACHAAHAGGCPHSGHCHCSRHLCKRRAALCACSSGGKHGAHNESWMWGGAGAVIQRWQAVVRSLHMLRLRGQNTAAQSKNNCEGRLSLSAHLPGSPKGS